MKLTLKQLEGLSDATEVGCHALHLRELGHNTERPDWSFVRIPVGELRELLQGQGKKNTAKKRKSDAKSKGQQGPGVESDSDPGQSVPAEE